MFNQKSKITFEETLKVNDKFYIFHIKGLSSRRRQLLRVLIGVHSQLNCDQLSIIGSQYKEFLFKTEEELKQEIIKMVNSL